MVCFRYIIVNNLRECNIIIIIIIMYCNNNFNGKFWAVFAPKLAGPPGDLDYRAPDYEGTTLIPWSRVHEKLIVAQLFSILSH
jgi:hypothetical protein